MRYDEQVAFARMTERQEAILLVGVIGIGESQGQRIAKDGGHFLEGDTMLGQVGSAFSGSYSKSMSLT